ncbi:hypothetical protein BURK2_04420 [Burkholderiales bacterium]|nr:hypothetical protein BURK2_04420 [Burkholderiales bacterium]
MPPTNSDQLRLVGFAILVFAMLALFFNQVVLRPLERIEPNSDREFLEREIASINDAIRTDGNLRDILVIHKARLTLGATYYATSGAAPVEVLDAALRSLTWQEDPLPRGRALRWLCKGRYRARIGQTPSEHTRLELSVKEFAGDSDCSDR